MVKGGPTIMLYQPNERELALCVGRDDVFRSAQAILADANRFALKPDGNIVVDEDKGRITIYLNLGKCTCRTFRLSPWKSPRPDGKHVTHCQHTLAWETYKRILREHYQLQRNQIMLPDRWQQGQHHPKDATTYFVFANWLSENSRRSAAILEAEANRYTKLPTGYTIPQQG